MEKVYGYDAVFYDRRFMNCGQRHAIVLLAERGVPVDYLFCSAWVGSDLVYEQVVVGKRPKFAFESEFYAAGDLASVGVTLHETEVDDYAEIAGLIAEGIARQGFVLLSGDVFYFPHCPEYRNTHAPHIVVLAGRNGAGDWHVIDDNAASVLCEYAYPAAMVEDFFNNNVDRKLRWFDVVAVPDRVQLRTQSLRRLAAVFSSQADTYRLYDQATAILADPYDSLAIKLKALHDAFCLLSGARSCVAGFLQEVGAPATLVAQLRAFAEKAAALKGMMVKAQITNRIDLEKLGVLCALLKSRDQANAAGLARYLDSAGMTDMPALAALAPVGP